VANTSETIGSKFITVINMSVALMLKMQGKFLMNAVNLNFILLCNVSSFLFIFWLKGSSIPIS
jgi:hypothetical protein